MGILIKLPIFANTVPPPELAANAAILYREAVVFLKSVTTNDGFLFAVITYLFLFTNKGELEWSNIIRKEQFDDESDQRISYNVMNTGGQLHFLFNMQEKKNLLLNDFSLTPDGQITRNPTLRGLDKGHEFLPKYGKQISAKQFIVPCFYRNYICFAKIEFN